MRHYRLLNVFTVPGVQFSGNPLCVVEDGEGLTTVDMQAIARQFNLSETTFILKPKAASARVRIFTPTFEMPFAGHPTLGTAYVVRAQQGGGELTLEMKAGVIRVSSEGDRFTLKALKKPVTRPPRATPLALAGMLNLPKTAVGKPLWVDTGVEQLILPLATAEQVRRARPNVESLARLGFSDARGESMAFIWARAKVGELVARFFFLQNGALIEDPATGSACANLGGHLIATGEPLPVRWKIRQGAEIDRPSVLHLTVDAGGGIFVGGDVAEIGRGTLEV